MPEPTVSAFGQLLRRRRKNAGLTQKELAAAAGVSERTISDLERGINQTARVETARLLAQALGLEGPDRIIFESHARGPQPEEGGEAQIYAAGLAGPPRTLPRDIASFTGREPELRELLEVAARAGGMVAINAIDGMAGIGKSALAVHAAHQLAGRYPDGQIFLDLHGHTPGQRPVEPVDGLASLLLTAGVPPQQIGEGLEARMALWRDRMAGKHLLLVFDDAVSSEQVWPLLPGTAGSLVLVTTRRHLTALEDAHVIRLGSLSPAEAASLLIQLADRPGLDRNDPAVTKITALCGYLPLAIGMLGRQLYHRPAWAPAQAGAYLAAARNRLEAMKTENLSVAAAFELSYRDLSPDQQRLFRLLGLHPGTGIDACAAAALGGIDLDTARTLLEALYDQNLLTEPVLGQYGLHDLLRRYAQGLATADSGHHQALERLLDYYQHTANRAEARLARQTRPSAALPPTLGPAAAPALQDASQALAWARGERASLLACLDLVTRTGSHGRVIAFTAALAALLRRDGPWEEATARHTTAIQAAQLLGDRLGAANALSDLGIVRREMGEGPAAVRALEQALGIYRDLGDRLGEANALSDLGTARRQADDHLAAVQTAEQTLGIYRDLGDQRGEANALSDLGTARRLTGEYPAAVQAHEQALHICRDLGDQLGEATALSNLGAVQLQTGQYPAAGQSLEQALAIFRGLGYRLGEANALNNLGDTYRSTGDLPAAAQAIEQALDIYRAIGRRRGEAGALCSLGTVRRLMGEYAAAGRALEQARVIYLDAGSRGGEAEVLNEQGALHRVSEELAQAEMCHKQALNLARAIPSSWNEAHALAGLGRCALADGHAAPAKSLLQQALGIFQRTGAAEARDLVAELEDLADPGLNR